MAKRHFAISRSSWVSICGLSLLATCSTSVADAREAAQPFIDISAGSLPEAISELSREAGVSIGTDGNLPSQRTPAIKGRMDVGQALGRLLAGSGMVARRVGETAWRIERVRAPVDTADTPAEAPPEVFAADPIIVTGVKRAVPLGELPMAVALIRLQPAQTADPSSDTAMIAASSEGLAMTSLGPGRNRLFMRGIADGPFNGESQSTVAIVLDEARLTYSAPDPDIRLVDVDRVEILKGPQGALYGSGAIGGIYHVVTRKALLAETTLTAAAGGEAVADGSTGWNASATANLPIIRDAVALRVVGYAAREAGWIDTGTRADSNQSRITGARADLGIDAGGNWRLDLKGMLQLLESKDSRYVYQRGSRARPDQFPEPHDNDIRHLAFTLARDGGGSQISISSGFVSHEVGDVLDATSGATSFGLPSPTVLTDDRTYRVWDSEARISQSTGWLKWLVGVSHVEARQSALQTLHASGGSSLTIDDDRRDAFDTALFGDVTLPIMPHLEVQAGGRLFHSSQIETRHFVTGTVARKQERNGFTPSLAVSLKLDPRNMLYVRYASAYRNGGSDITPAGGLDILRGDSLRTIEAGWRGEFLHGAHAELGLYGTRWNNLQTDQLQPDGLIETENAGAARILGVEASLNMPLDDGFRMQAGADFTDAVLTRNMLGRTLDDRRLPVVPKFAARASLEKRFTVGRIDASLRAQVRYIGPQRLSFDPQIDRRMGSYVEDRIEGHFSIGGTQLTLSADNLFGGAQDSFAFGNPFRFATMPQFTPLRPARVSISILREF